MQSPVAVANFRQLAGERAGHDHGQDLLELGLLLALLAIIALGAMTALGNTMSGGLWSAHAGPSV